MEKLQIHTEPGMIHMMQSHSIFFLHHGIGEIEVDFKRYSLPPGKVFFLSPGQYLKQISGSFTILRINIPMELVNRYHPSRFLFTHLVALSHVDADGKDLKQVFTGNQSDPTAGYADLLRLSAQKWIHLNPFHAPDHEVELLFNLKDAVDDQFRNPVSLESISKQLKVNGHRIGRLTKERLNKSVKQMILEKRFLEACRKIAFTNLSTKEISYELGFNDPSYFNRFFYRHSGINPGVFRNRFPFPRPGSLLESLHRLVDTHYKEHHKMNFYADQLHLTAKSLGRKLRKESACTVPNLVRKKIMDESMKMLRHGMPVHQVAFDLGFREPNHFSAYFKAATGATPTEFIIAMQKVQGSGDFS